MGFISRPAVGIPLRLPAINTAPDPQKGSKMLLALVAYRLTNSSASRETIFAGYLSSRVGKRVVIKPSSGSKSCRRRGKRIRGCGVMGRHKRRQEGRRILER